MDLSLEGKSVIVTGAGSNIGRAIALLFGEEKANVVIAELDEKQGNKVADEIKAKGGKALVIQTDVTDFDKVQTMVKKTVEEYGKLDVLVNNVGWIVEDFFINEDPKKWETVININYKGMMYCTKAALDVMVPQKSGCVVSLGSDAGRMGEFREGVYAGCKGGVIALTKTLAREVGRNGIRLNVVCPGLVVPKKDDVGEESMWVAKDEEGKSMLDVFTPEAQEKAKKAYPLRKLGTAENIANAVVFLASDRASYITGQTLSVSGGYTMM
jgi:NAD(P)-dependent dehydrogenase (short-subunit alcohol dehydrogenase family)